VGILFNALFVIPVQRFLKRQDDARQARLDAGESVFPIKPSFLFPLILIGIFITALILRI
jgi:hypothetical protein